LSRGQVEYENHNQYFLDAVRKELAGQYGDRAVYEGGLKIYTTLDPELQEHAMTAVEKVVAPESGDPSASLVSVEPSTGAVKAMVGGSDFEQVKFNLATQGKRQPGSSFKMFVLAEAIRQGISPDTVYTSRNLNIDMGVGADPYRVYNYNYVERGPSPLRPPPSNQTTQSTSSLPRIWGWRTWRRWRTTSASGAPLTSTPRWR